jgi:hypothetical protein
MDRPATYSGYGQALLVSLVLFQIISAGIAAQSDYLTLAADSARVIRD